MKFSILIPTYKDRFLKDCIESVLNQTYDDFEIIIVNDASPYDIDSVVTKYVDSRIHYFRNEIGFGAEKVVGNWNKCLSFAKGDYVICMGDDDMLLKNCLQDYAVLIEKYPYLDVFHGRSEIVDENAKLKELQESRPEWESAYSVLYHQCHCHRRQFIGDFLFRTEALRQEGGFYKLPYAIYSDNITGLRAAENKGVANTQNIVFQYRKNSHTITGNPQYKEFAMDALLAYHWYYKFLEKIPSDPTDQKFRELLLLHDLKDSIEETQLWCIREDIKRNGKSAIKYWRENLLQYELSEWKFYACIDKLRYEKVRGVIDSVKKFF